MGNELWGGSDLHDHWLTSGGQLCWRVESRRLLERGRKPNQPAGEDDEPVVLSVPDDAVELATLLFHWLVLGAHPERRRYGRRDRGRPGVVDPADESPFATRTTPL